MKCPFCGHNDSQVLESRDVGENLGIRRRRACIKCGKRFTTYERIRAQTLWVIKKDGRREPFDKEKIRRGVLRAVEKRPIPLNVVNSLVDDIEREMLRNEKEEIQTKVIGNAVLTRLKKIDKVAWLRFASVYLEFKDLEDFAKLIERKK